jgi:two-component system, LytTR family, response regulator
MIHSIHINTTSGPHELLISSIVRIEGSSSYSKIFFAGKLYPLLASKVLHWFEDNLYDKSFIRTHKSHLVNRQYIQRFCRDSRQVELQSGETIAVSKRKYSAVKKILMAEAIE